MAFKNRDPDYFDITTQSEATANDSDKAVTVTAGRSWRMVLIQVAFTATATVGTRTLLVEIRDAADAVILTLKHSSNAITASEVMTFQWFVGALLVAPTDGAITGTQEMPDLLLPAGWDIRCYDSAAVDAAADDMTLTFITQEHKET